MTRLRSCGEDGLLLDCADLDEARRHHAALARDHRVREAVLGARTVLLRGEPEALRAAVAATEAGDTVPDTGREHVLSVVYDGADLEQVGSLTGLGAEGVVAAHTRTPWTVAFGGFAPGFAYLVGGDPRLAVPRLDTPRDAVPAGAVGLAGEFSGVYPRTSPGGWQLIGRCDAVLFDPGREPAALLAPGDVVRFQRTTPDGR